MSTELIIAGEMGKGGGGVEGVDTLISRQTIKTLFVVGEGVISGIDQVYLDTVGIERFDADLVTRTGTTNQTVIDGFTETEAPLPGFVGKIVTKGDSSIPNVDISPIVNTTAPNFVVNKFYRITTLGNTTTAQWLDIGAGTKYVPAAIGMTFKAKKAGIGTGSGVEQVRFEQNTYETAIPYDVNRARLTFSIPVMIHTDDSGNTGGSSVELEIYTRKDSTSTWNLVANFTKKGKTTHGYTFDKEVSRPSDANPNNKVPWGVKVLRVTADPATNNSKTQNQITWANVTQIYDATHTYPDSALVAITLRDASQFGNKVPEIMFRVKGKLVLVPSNYDAVNKTYTGNWTSGSWYSVLGVVTKVYTNNPAWVLYDVLTDTRAGLGLSQADIDIYSIYLLGKYADESIPFMEGNNQVTISRYTIDYSFQTRQSVHEFLSQILSICNANLITNELGQVAVIFQYPGQVVRRNLSNSNVVDGIFTYQSSNIEQRTTLVNVTYNNGKNFGRTDTTTVFEQDLIDRYGLQPIDVVLPGCYYEAQAIRKARWTLYSNCHFTNFVTFNVFLDGLNYKIGDLIRVYDNYNQNTQQAGTIASYSSASGTTTIVFDRTLNLTDGTYTFYCYNTAGLEITKTISVAGSIATATTVAIPAGTVNYPDYDYQGYVTKYGVPNFATGSHLTDEFKLPSHITFSVDSIYSSTNFLGGTWTGSGTTWHFYPSVYNLTQHTAAEFIDYFTHAEYIDTYLHLNGQTYQGTVPLGGTPFETTVYVQKQFPGAIDQRTVNSSTLDRITLDSVVTLNLGGVFILSGLAAGKVYRITNISKSEESQYSVTGLEFNDAIFDYIDSGIDITPLTGDFVNVDQFYTTDVESIAWSDSSATNGSYSNSTLHLTWVWDSAKTQKYRANFRLSYSGPTANTVMIDQINTDNYDIANPVPGRYIVTVWAVNPFTGISSKPKTQVVDFRIDSTVVSTLQSPINVRVTGTTAVSPQPTSITFASPDLSLSFDYNPDNQAVADALGDYLVEIYTSAGVLKASYPVIAEKTSSSAVDPTNPETNYYPLNGNFQFPLSENLHVFGGTPSRSFIVKIYSRDLFGHVSANPVSVTLTNPSPAQIDTAKFTVVSGISSVFVNIIASTEIDVKGYLVWRSTSANFTKDSSTLVYDGPNNYVTLPVPTAVKYYYSVAAYDSFDKTGYIPSVEKYSTPASADATTWTKTGLQFTANAATKTLSWTTGTIIRNATDSFTIAAGTSVWSTGFLYVYFNPSVSTTALQITTTLLTAVQMGCYPLATYTGGDNSTIKGGDGNAFISGSQIIAGTVGASEIKAGSIVASLLDTTNAVITGTAQIGNGVITNAAIKDMIMSTNYNPTTFQGWKIDKAGNIDTYGSLGIYDSNGNVVFAGGNFNWNNAKGPGVPQVGATRNVFLGNWVSGYNYVVGDIVMDALGYGWSCVTVHTSSGSVLTPVYPTTSNSYWALYTIKGGTGPAGLTTATVYIYQRSATSPALPTATTTYTFNSAVLTGLDNGWVTSIPTGTADLYVSAATASAGTATDTIASTEWATPVVLAKNGTDGQPGGPGANGINTATIYLYQTTSSSAPPSLPNADITYTFATGATTGVTNNWVRSLPTTGAFRWVTTATALGTGATDTITTSEWAAVSLLSQDGVNGTRTAIMDMYQWSASTPSSFPAGTSTYTWATGQFTAPATLNGWSLTPPAPVAGQTLYVTRTVYADSGTTSTTSITWNASTATARGTAGTNGVNGSRTAFMELYLWSASTPSTYPSGNSTYTWATGVFTAPSTPNGWSLLPGPAVKGQTLYAIGQSYSDTGTSGSTSIAWASSTPYAVGSAGTDGTPGVCTFTAQVYYNGVTSTLPTGGSYNFSSNVLTAPSGWSTTPYTSTTTGTSVSTCVFTTTTPNTTVSATGWSTPVLYQKNGSDGKAAVLAQLSSDSLVISCNNDGSAVSGAFATATVTMTVMNGTTDDSLNWTYSVSVSNCTSASVSTSRSQTLNGITTGVATAYIDFTASRTGYSSLTKRCVISKSYMGGTGAPGAGKSYTGASDPTPTTPVASDGDTYFQTTSQLMWIKIAGTWQKVIPQITNGNATTFIASGAIGQLQVGSAAIGTAQIIDANVQTLKIQGNAVTVPLGAYTAASRNVTSLPLAGGVFPTSYGYRVVESLTTGILATDVPTKVLITFSVRTTATAPYFILVDDTATTATTSWLMYIFPPMQLLTFAIQATVPINTSRTFRLLTDSFADTVQNTSLSILAVKR